MSIYGNIYKVVKVVGSMFYNFIICEDNNFFNESYQKIVNKVAKDLKINIKIHSFEIYNDEFRNVIYDNIIENKIYILDIMMPEIKGHDIAKIIRSIDFVSLIIFITSYYKDFSFDITNGEYAYLKYIDKSKDYENQLYNVLKDTIIKLQNIKTLKIETKDKIYTIIPKDINCIYTEDRKIAIKNIHDHIITIPMTLNTIKSMLPDFFVLSKNCCLVNINRIVEIDKKNKMIHFDNYTYTNLVSRKYLKQIISESDKKKT